MSPPPDAALPAQPPAGDIDPAIVRQAVAWMARLWSDEAGEADKAGCAAWRAAHPDHELAWRRLQVLEDKLQGVPADVARHALRQPAAQAWAARRRVLQTLGLGAMTGGLAYLARHTDSWQLATAQHGTGTGEVRELVLPDGTRLMLASASAVDLRFTEHERLVVLKAGEILITTAADAAGRPFRVETRQGSVRALGTRFLVRQGEGVSQIAVFEGAVELRPAEAGSQVLRLDAGQGARLHEDGVGTPVEVHESAAAWSQGLLVADDMPLGDVVEALARYRSGVLRCDPTVAGLRVSGVFPLRDTDRALGNLALHLPVSVRYRTRYWVTVGPA